MKQVLTLRPTSMAPRQFDPVADPQWAALAEYLSSAASAGETVRLTTQIDALTPNQMAERLGISRASLMKAIERGELAAYRVGTHWRITIHEFDRYRAQLHANMISAASADIEAELYG